MPKSSHNRVHKNSKEQIAVMSLMKLNVSLGPFVNSDLVKALPCPESEENGAVTYPSVVSFGSRIYMKI